MTNLFPFLRFPFSYFLAYHVPNHMTNRLNMLHVLNCCSIVRHNPKNDPKVEETLEQIQVFF